MSKMTQKKAKAEIPADMWLHVATDALARWAAADNQIGVMDTVNEDGQPVLYIVLFGITVNDPRLAPAFVAGLRPVDHADPPERVDDRATVEPVGISQGVEHGGR